MSTLSIAYGSVFFFFLSLFLVAAWPYIREFLLALGSVVLFLAFSAIAVYTFLVSMVVLIVSIALLRFLKFFGIRYQWLTRFGISLVNSAERYHNVHDVFVALATRRLNAIL